MIRVYMYIYIYTYMVGCQNYGADETSSRAYRDLAVSQNKGYHFGDPHNKD